MHLTINGEPREVPDLVTVGGLLARLGLDRGPVAVEVNRQVVPRGEHAGHGLHPGDIVEIVHLVGGG